MSLCLQRPSWGLKVGFLLLHKTFVIKVLVTLNPASVSMATCWHHQGHLRSASRTAAVCTLAHACTPSAGTHPRPQASPTALPHPWGTTLSRAQRCTVSPCPEPLGPRQKKKKTLIEAKEGSEQGHAHSLLFKGAPGMWPRFRNENSNRFLDAFQAPASYSILVD